MADYQYTNVPGKCTEFLTKIRSIGVPSKATTPWLASLGYKSKNDRSFLHILEFIGFIDATGIPTQKWLDFRGKDYKKVLGGCLREAYYELFEVYSDAYAKTNEELGHFFSTKNKSGEQVISRIVKTFKALAEMASFDDLGNIKEDGNKIVASEDKSLDPSQASIPSVDFERGRTTELRPSIHIDLQIHISPDSSPDQIEKIFESMAKHIFKR